MRTVALIIAGGSGKRMNRSIPKQYLHINDKPVILYALETFQKCDAIDAIFVVSVAGWETMLWAYADQFGITKLKSIVSGGICGQESINNGIVEINKYYDAEDIVLIHDAIRPMVSNEIILV